MVEYEVTGRHFLITGEASGLGAFYAKEFLREGAEAVAILDIAEEGRALADELNSKYPGKVAFVKCDVCDERSISDAFEQAIEKFGHLDVLINNAGIISDARHIWRRMNEINVVQKATLTIPVCPLHPISYSLISLSMKAIKHMSREEGGAGGTIINAASVAALTKHDLVPIYCSTKMAILHFTQCIASENFYEQSGIRLMTICPATDTAILRNLKGRCRDEKSGEIFEQSLSKDNPMTNKQRPELVAAAVLKMFKEGANASIWLSMADGPEKIYYLFYRRSLSELPRISFTLN